MEAGLAQLGEAVPQCLYLLVSLVGVFQLITSIKMLDTHSYRVVGHRLDGGDHTLENMALSCRECTVRFKGSWNPVYVAGEDASRQELILVVRENVKKKRSSWVRCLSTCREIVGWEESESNRKDD